MKLKSHHLDNGQVDPTQVVPKALPNELRKVISWIFRGTSQAGSRPKVSFTDCLDLCLSTEIKAFLEDHFEPPLYFSDDKLVYEDHWVTLDLILKSNSTIVSTALSFYRQQVTSIGRRDLFEFLTEVWSTHRNTVYRVSAFLVLHMISLSILYDRNN